jgi:hypothetical protein
MGKKGECILMAGRNLVALKYMLMMEKCKIRLYKILEFGGLQS